MTLEWIDPPMNRADEARELATALRARPNEWARFARSVTPEEWFDWAVHLDYEERVEERRVRVDTGWWGNLFEFARRYDIYARARKEAE